MPKQTILFGRMGNKTNDIKHFKHLLPMNIKNVVEPFGGSFAVTRIIYSEEKYKKFVNDNDEILYHIYKNPDKYAKMSRELNEIAKNTINENGNVIHKKFISKIQDNDYDEKFLDYWKTEKIIKGRIIKTTKNVNYSEFIKCMKSIIFSCKDYKDIVNEFKTNKDTFIFLDPPYLFSDNSQYSVQKRKEGMDMTHILYEVQEIFNDKTTKAKIMMIINDMKIIRYMFNKFIKCEYERIYQLGKRKSIHLVITNY